MKEIKKFSAIPIPERNANYHKELFSSGRSDHSTSARSLEVAFSEIEYDFDESIYMGKGKAKDAAAPQSIVQKVSDPIREKFFNMRRLASGNPFARNDAGLFYKQGRFMESFADDYSGNALFNMYYPYYQHMGYEQLRTYFAWRTKVRDGLILKTSLSYVFLYIYELLSGIGVTYPIDGLKILVALWCEYRKFEPILDKYLPLWLKDYHIYYMLEHSFTDFIKDHNFQKFYPEISLFNAADIHSIEIWNSISTYDIKKSKFYTSGNESLMSECFTCVMSGINKLCDSRSIRVEDLLVSGISTQYTWYPFNYALFFNWKNQSDRIVKISDSEVYTCSDNRWTANKVIFGTGRRELVGYLIKTTEMHLRKAVNFKYSLTTNPDTIVDYLCKFGLSIEEFNSSVMSSISEYYRQKTRTIVTVNHKNLARIREEAIGTQDKLMVPDDEIPSFISSEKEILHQSFNDSQSMCPVSVSDPWAALSKALNDIEREFLMMLICESEDINAVFENKGIMLEVLVDSINEKAFDYLGDNIIEMNNGMLIYEEYKNNVEELVKM